MKQTHQEPAKTIIYALGGPSKVAAITGASRGRVSNWMRPKAVGGTGGTIPQKHIRLLLSEAERLGVDLSADDFIPREADDVVAPRKSSRAKQAEAAQ